MRTIAAIFLIFSMPGSAVAAIKITEVAWMGTAASQFGEWVELYNDSDSEVDLAGAALFESGGSVQVIALTKKIGSRGYFVVERTTASSPDPLPGISDDSGAFGGGGLNNGGEFLVLKNVAGAVLDQIDASGGWPAGDSSTKETMQWDGSRWVTAPATPRVALAGAVSASSGDSSSSATSSAFAASSTTQAQASSLPAASAVSSAHASPVPLSVPTVIHPAIIASPGRDRLGSIGKPVSFEANVFLQDSLGEIRDAAFSWSFGDGGAASGKMAEHAYQFPGIYHVVLNVLRGEERAVGRTVVRVVDPKLRISRVVHESVPFIEIESGSDAEVNIGGSSLRTPVRQFVLPEDTIIAPRGRIQIPGRITGLSPQPGEQVHLVLADGTFAASGSPLVPPPSPPVQAELPRSSAASAQPVLIPPVSAAAVTSKPPVSSALQKPTVSNATSTPQLIIEIPKKKGIIDSVLAVPRRAAAFLGGLFFGE